MTKQFKHEPNGYVPILSDEGSKKRPWWLEDDEVLIYFYDNNRNLDLKTKKIKELSKNEFINFQKEGLIPKEYKLEDWIK